MYEYICAMPLLTKKSFLRLLPFFGLCTVLVALLYYYPTVVRHFGRSALESYGLQNVEFEVGAPSGTHWNLETVAFDAVLDDKVVAVRSDWFRFRYRLLDLLQGTLSGVEMGGVRIQNEQLRLSAEQLQLSFTPVEEARKEHIEEASGETKGEASVEHLEVQVDELKLPKMHGELEFVLREEEANATLRISGAELSFRLVGAIQLKRQTNQMALRLSLLPLNWKNTQALLQHFSVELPKALRVRSAQLQGDFSADWRADRLRDPELRVAVQSGSLAYEGISIEKLAGKCSYGLDASHSPLRVSGLEAELFGGRIEVPKARIFLKKKRGAAEMLLRGIDLAELLKLYPQERVSAEGRVSGKLPFIWEQRGVSVTDGAVSSDGKGVLRAQLLNSEQQDGVLQQGLGIAAKALENYHFDSLDTGVTLDEAGDLDLALSLKGRNPDFQGGRAINFSINVSENIPALLKSLEINSKMNEIGSRLKEGKR